MEVDKIFEKIIINTAERFIGYRDNYRVSIVMVNHRHADYDIVKNNKIVLEATGEFKNITSCIEHCIEYVDNNNLNIKNVDIDKRTKQCVELEMGFNADGFYGKSDYNKDFNIHSTDIVCKTDEEWDIMIAEMNAELLRRKKPRVYDVKIDEAEDHIMTVKEWLSSVKEGYFGNYDGYGYWMKDGLACRDEVFSSEPLDATHVVWYNK